MHEKEVLEQEQAWDLTPLGLARVAPDGHFIGINPAMTRMLGRSEQELLSTEYDLVVHPFDAKFAGIVAMSTAGDTWSTYQAEKRYIRADKANLWGLVTAVPVRGEDGSLLHVFFQIQDISERKAAEEKTEVLAQRLKQSNRELRSFATVASHDLREPLRKINAFGGRLQSMIEGKVDDKAEDYLRRILNAADRMVQLIEGLLELAQVDTKGQPFSELDLNHIVSEVLSDLETRIEREDATVHVGDLPTVDGDKLQIRLLLQNLTANALKFHKPGEKPVVHIDAEQFAAAGEEYVRVTVKDEGIGLESEYADKIFQAFQRLHSKEEYEGSGIGLAICKRIVERHYGEIHCTSKPGEGTTFTVMLPKQQQESEDSE